MDGTPPSAGVASVEVAVAGVAGVTSADGPPGLFVAAASVAVALVGPPTAAWASVCCRRDLLAVSWSGPFRDLMCVASAAAVCGKPEACRQAASHQCAVSGLETYTRRSKHTKWCCSSTRSCLMFLHDACVPHHPGIMSRTPCLCHLPAAATATSSRMQAARMKTVSCVS